MPIDKIIDNILRDINSQPVVEEPQEIAIEEGMLLSVNKLVSDAIKIPEGEYIVWAINSDTCQLMPTSESAFDVIEISRPTLKGFYNPEVHKRTVNNSKGIINETNNGNA